MLLYVLFALQAWNCAPACVGSWDLAESLGAPVGRPGGPPRGRWYPQTPTRRDRPPAAAGATHWSSSPTGDHTRATGRPGEKRTHFTARTVTAATRCSTVTPLTNDLDTEMCVMCSWVSKKVLFICVVAGKTPRVFVLDIKLRDKMCVSTTAVTTLRAKQYGGWIRQRQENSLWKVCC